MERYPYSASNCKAAFQLNWSLTVFSDSGFSGIEKLAEQVSPLLENDGVRILEWRLKNQDVLQFFLSTKPDLPPTEIVRFLKARLQYASRNSQPIKFKRNYGIRSVGTANDKVLDHYIAIQPERHPMAQERVQAMFQEIQYHDSLVEISRPRTTSHGQYIYGLQVVVESQGDWNNVHKDSLNGYIHSIKNTCIRNEWLLSRIGILANHIHILVGPGATDSPENVALELLNELSKSETTIAQFKFSFYVGTFGPYNRAAIWNALRDCW